MDKNICIALVDDHQLFRKGMAAILNAAEGLEVVMEAGNGREFINLLESKAQPNPDLVLLDLEMPVMDGMQTMLALQDGFPGIKVILLTMHADDHFALHFMKSGANAFLLKDSGPEEVETAIAKVMSHGYYINERVSEILLRGVRNETKEGVLAFGQDALSTRELDVLKLICQEHTSQEIGDQLFISPRTVEGHRQKLFEKTGSKNIAGLVLFAVRNGLIE